MYSPCSPTLTGMCVLLPHLGDVWGLGLVGGVKVPRMCMHFCYVYIGGARTSNEHPGRATNRPITQGPTIRFRLLVGRWVQWSVCVVSQRPVQHKPYQTNPTKAPKGHYNKQAKFHHGSSHKLASPKPMLYKPYQDKPSQGPNGALQQAS
jgi:hypothetical protein